MNVWILRCIKIKMATICLTLILASESSQNYSVLWAIVTKRHIAVFYWITNTVQIHELKDANRYIFKTKQ